MSPQRCLLIAVLFALALPRIATAQTAHDFFQKNCVTCHTIGGGRLIGPDLKEAVQQKDRAWLEHFIQDPEAVLDSGDPYALQLKKEANGIVMPKMPGMTPEMAKALLDMIEVESKLPKSSLAATGISEQPFTPNDVAAGMEIFLGKRKLSAGGPPCSPAIRSGRSVILEADVWGRPDSGLSAAWRPEISRCLAFRSRHTDDAVGFPGSSAPIGGNPAAISSL